MMEIKEIVKNKISIYVDKTDKDLTVKEFLETANALVDRFSELEEVNIDLNHVDITSEAIAPILFLRRMGIQHKVPVYVFNLKIGGSLDSVLQKTGLYKSVIEGKQ